jgi:hypothetical protein
MATQTQHSSNRDSISVQVRAIPNANKVENEDGIYKHENTNNKIN